jgi:hypothetical protein
VEGLPLEDYVSVMEGIIDNLRQVPDWGNQPKGFAGACLLARQFPEAALVLKRFVVGIEQPIWMKTMLKSEQWFKE